MDSQYIDILHLLHDIYIANKSKTKAFRHYLNKIEFANSRLIFDSHLELIQFIKQTVNARKKQYIPSALKHSNTDHTPINWLSVLYNEAFVNTEERLAIISPILSLYKNNNNKQFNAIHIIRKYIPSSHIKGIEDNNYLSLNVEGLFGSFKHLNVDHLSMDLCKQIVSYLNLPQFFKCSLINHCWLNLIYRNNTFHAILKACINTESIKCVIVDHSSLNRMESAHLSKIFINWQLRSNSVYLDFITLQKSWIEHYIDTNSIQLTLQQYKDNDKETNDWISLKSVTPNKLSKKLFDCMDVFDCMMNDTSIYRLKIEITSPFEWILYTEPRDLKPFDWHKKYHSNQIGIETEQQFWFEYYIDLLYSMIDGDISQALTTIMEAAQRMKFHHEFVKAQLLDPQIMRQIVRLLNHKDWRIQHNAAILCSNIFATNQLTVRDTYLNLSSFGIKDYNVIDVALRNIYNILKERQFELEEGEYRVCRSLICVVGNYVISAHKEDLWKRLALTNTIQYVPFMIGVLNKEAMFVSEQSKNNEQININKWSFRAMAIWSLSTFYRNSSEDDVVNAILDAIVSRQMIELFIDWSVVVGHQYMMNQKIMHNKMNKLLNKLN